VLRVIHSADWHLGHSLHGISRHYEQQCFLQWLLDYLQQVEADALVVAGDIFDSTNPPASAFALFYGFLTDARRRLPGLDLIFIGGNHDSAARLEAPSSLFQALGIHVIGAVIDTPEGDLDCGRLLIPMTAKDGRIEGWCAAMPFLRNADLPLVEEGKDPLIEGVRRHYQALFQAAAAQRQEGQALLATGHCYMVNSQLSEMSERRILGGNQHALPADIFPPEVTYAALGHLHLAQVVDGEGRIRYSGSPIPLSLDEAGYPHQVLQVEFEQGSLIDAQAVPVPRSVEILRLPRDGPAVLEQVIERLGQLELNPGLPPERYPFLEVRVLLERPEPGLRHAIEEQCEGRPVRLLKVSSHYPGSGESLADMLPQQRLEELDPEQVFSRCYQAACDTLPPDDLLACFRELLESLPQGAD